MYKILNALGQGAQVVRLATKTSKIQKRAKNTQPVTTQPSAQDEVNNSAENNANKAFCQTLLDPASSALLTECGVEKCRKVTLTYISAVISQPLTHCITDNKTLQNLSTKIPITIINKKHSI